MKTNDNPEQISSFKNGESKKIIMGFRETDGRIQVLVESEGLNDDTKNIASIVNYALENMIT